MTMFTACLFGVVVGVSTDPFSWQGAAIVLAWVMDRTAVLHRHSKEMEGDELEDNEGLE